MNWCEKVLEKYSMTVFTVISIFRHRYNFKQVKRPVTYCDLQGSVKKIKK